ncbi:hypothetical protein LguiA_005073 [Lonicera macranthoides]
MIWILNSISLNLADNVIYTNTPAEIWEELWSDYHKATPLKIFKSSMKLSKIGNNSNPYQPTTLNSKPSGMNCHHIIACPHVHVEALRRYVVRNNKNN